MTSVLIDTDFEQGNRDRLWQRALYIAGKHKVGEERGRMSLGKHKKLTGVTPTNTSWLCGSGSVNWLHSAHGFGSVRSASALKGRGERQLLLSSRCGGIDENTDVSDKRVMA